MPAMVRGIGRVCFRFMLFYWICFTFAFPLDLVGLPLAFVDPDDQPTWMKAAGEKYIAAFTWIAKQKDDTCVWIAEHVFHVEAIVQPTGSGDTMRAYVGCLCAAAIAAALALAWTGIVFVVHRRKPDGDP